MPDTESHRWAIYIDILGFSYLWDDEERQALHPLNDDGMWQALHPLNELMLAIYRIGTKVYPDQGQRLFAHQMGDGFAIVSDSSSESSFERPIAIAIALMRCVASTGKFASAAIAEGDFADTMGCYPQEVREGRDCSDHDVIKLGHGRMTLFSVMGTAFIRAYRLHKKGPSGPFLTVAKRHQPHIPESLPVRTVKEVQRELLSIDWIASRYADPYVYSRASLSRSLPNRTTCCRRSRITACGIQAKMADQWGSQLCALLDHQDGIKNSSSAAPYLPSRVGERVPNRPEPWPDLLWPPGMVSKLPSTFVMRKGGTYVAIWEATRKLLIRRRG